MTKGHTTCLYGHHELDEVLNKMAFQAATYLKNKPRIVIVGILRRGVPLSEMLHTKLAELLDIDNMTMLQLEIKRYADDLTLLYPETKLTERPEGASINLAGATVLVVDDVMYQGYSMSRALEYLASKCATEIKTAVLVDRSVRKLPVTADIVGVHLQVASSDIIECHVPPYEPEFSIDLVKPAGK